MSKDTGQPVIFFAVLVWFGLAGGLISADRAPNILYIISDDQSWTDFGFMGNERVHTPHLDRLAEQSALYLNGYLTTSVCRPSLVTLMTGLYPHQHGVYFNHGPPGNSAYNRMNSREAYERARKPENEIIQKVSTLPRLLAQELGYRCFQTGKYWEGHWKSGGFTEGMTTFEPPPEGQDFGGVRVLANGDRVAHGNGDLGLQIGRVTLEPIKNFIHDCETEQTPWMVWYAPYLPHQPHDSPQRFYDLASARPGVEAHEVPYFASIAQFDETVGELIRLVESHSDMGNTIIVFVSDNGWSPDIVPQKGREEEFRPTKRSKRAPFDAGVRSPILIRWDARVSPAIHEELVSSIDIVATLVNAVGLNHGEFPGRDLLGVLDQDRAVFGAIYPGDATKLGQPEADVAYRWVRRGKWKLILPESPDAWGGYLSAPALFDVEADPHELDNLAGTKRGEKPLIELKEKLDQWWNPRETAARRTAQNIAAVCASASAAGLFFVAEAKGNFDRTLDLIVKGARVEDAGSPFDGTWFGTPQYTKEDLEAAKPYLRIEVGLLIYQP